MGDFVGLFVVLHDWFEKPLDQLPSDLRRRVEQDFAPFTWDNLSVEQRRMAAEQWDYRHDPATEEERAEAGAQVSERTEIERQIREVELLEVQTPVDHQSKTRQLGELRARLEKVKARRKRRRANNASKAHAPDEDAARCVEHRDSGARGKYIHFLKARDLLKDRWGATTEEVGIWVWMGANCGGLDGYRDALQYDSPPRFFFSPYDGDADYIPELMHCYFKRDDLEAFRPSDRYLTYAQLVDRWREHLSEREIVALIKSKGETGELSGFHPLTGGVQEAGMFGDQEGFPPLEQGMFCLAHVEAVEAECFNSVATQSLPSAQSSGADVVLSEATGAAPTSQTKPGQMSAPVASTKIMSAFPISKNLQQNHRWWNTRMRDAKDYDLVDCRALPGRAGQPSLWYPHLVASWLVDKQHKEAKEVAEILRKHFPDCAETAEWLYPSGD